VLFVQAFAQALQSSFSSRVVCGKEREWVFGRLAPV
jgi:hypothetical protein